MNALSFALLAAFGALASAVDREWWQAAGLAATTVVLLAVHLWPEVRR